MPAWLASAPISTKRGTASSVKLAVALVIRRIARPVDWSVSAM